MTRALSPWRFVSTTASTGVPSGMTPNGSRRASAAWARVATEKAAASTAPASNNFISVSPRTFAGEDETPASPSRGFVGSAVDVEPERQPSRIAELLLLLQRMKPRGLVVAECTLQADAAVEGSPAGRL